MKNNKFKDSKPFAKKWFYFAIAFGVVFAIITTIIAIFKNVNSTKTRKIQEQGFIETSENKKGIIKSPYPYETLDNNFTEAKTNDDFKKSQMNTPKEKTDKIDDVTSIEEENDENSEFVKPVQDGQILQKFSDNELVKWPSLGSYKTHDGIDIAAKKNKPVKACADGIISNIKNEDGTWGIAITIKHKNGLKSIYKGLSENLQVKLDQQVKAGDIIGTIGANNKIESNLKEHLHFEMQKNGKWVDPQSYIDFE